MNNSIKIIIGILLPIIGTTFGSALVFLLKNKMSKHAAKIVNSLAAGLMISSAIFGLLIPALEHSDNTVYNLISSSCGFAVGFLFVIIAEVFLKKFRLNRNSKIFVSMVLHNIPEGIAVGMVFLGVMSNSHGVTYESAMALSLGIALQNIPEGAIISLPNHKDGKGKLKAFGNGVLSGAIEPVCSVLTICASQIMLKFYQFTLSFAAGAMMFVVMHELITDFYSEEKHEMTYSFVFLCGFILMMSSEYFFS